MKQAMMVMSGALLSQILIETDEIHVKVENGLPEDAKFVEMRYNFDDNEWYFVFESNTFEDITDKTAAMPLLPPAKFTRLDCSEGAA